jgi:O-antigen/teichoic acid export membrane protein
MSLVRTVTERLSAISGHTLNSSTAPSQTPSLLSKTGMSALAGLITVAGRFVVGIYTARLLGPEQVGYLAYLLWIAEFLATVIGLGLPAATTYFVADLRGQRRITEAYFVRRWTYSPYLALALLGTVAAALWASKAGSSNPHNLELVACFAVYFLMQTIGIFHLAYLAGHQNFGAIARINLVASVTLVIGVFALTPVWGLPGTLAGFLIGALPVAVPGLFHLRAEPTPQPVDLSLRSRLYRYAMYSWFATVVSTFSWSRTEIFFIERYWGSASVAMFTAGLTLSGLATQTPILLSGALLAHFAELRGTNDFEAIKKLYSTGIRLLALLTLPLCFGLASITPVLLPLLYGRAFEGAVPNAVVLIAFSAVFYTLAVLCAALLAGLGRPGVRAAFEAGGAIASITAGFLIVPHWGPWGAAWSRSVLQGCMVAVSMFYISRFLHCKTPLRDLQKTLLAALLAASCSAVLTRTLPTWGGILTAIPLAGAVYVLLIGFFRILHPDDLAPLSRVAGKLPGRLSIYANRTLVWLCRAGA